MGVFYFLYKNKNPFFFFTFFLLYLSFLYLLEKKKLTMGHNHNHSHDNEHTPLIHQHGHNHGSTVIANSNSCSNMASKEDSSAKSTKRRLAIATTIALLFFATELVAGYFANSLGKILYCSRLYITFCSYQFSSCCLALMSDAFHLLSDVASFIVALAAIYLAEKPPTKSKIYFRKRERPIIEFIIFFRAYIWIP